MFGREPRLPIDVYSGGVDGVTNDVNQYGLELTLHLRDAYEIVKANLTQAAEKAQARWNQQWHKPHLTLEPGDKVC